MTFHSIGRGMARLAALMVLVSGTLSSAAPSVEDAGKKACVQEARTLCPIEMQSMRRKKVEACMIAKIERTSPVCHAAMLRIKATREAATKP